MNFLNALLLGGAAAALAPLAIHLLNRSRFKTVDWGAMHLLDAAIEVNSRRIQWQSLLLLLTRCLIPILLAFSLARPVLTDFQSSGARGDKSLLLLVDDSLSMDMRLEDSTLLQQAKKLLAAILLQSDSDEQALRTTSGSGPQLARPSTRASESDGVEIQSSFDNRRMVETLEAVAGSKGSGDPLAALPSAVDQVSALSKPNKHIVFVSDFQSVHWRALATASTPGLATATKLSNIKQQMAAQSVQLTLMPVGKRPQTSTEARPAQPNLAVQLGSSRRATVGVDQPHRVAATVTNYSSSSVADVQIVFCVDGLQLAKRSISVSPNASERVDFACQFAELGWHWASISVSDRLGVPSDNVAYEIIQVAAPPRILIADRSVPSNRSSKNEILANDGRGKSTAFVGTSRFHQLALAPFTGDDLEQNPFQIQVAKPDILTIATIKNFDAVVLADIQRLSEQQSQAIESYVREGGGLLVFANKDLDVSAINERWGTQGQMLPMSYGEWQTTDANQPLRLSVGSWQQPSRGPSLLASSDLNKVEIMQFLPLIAPDSNQTLTPPGIDVSPQSVPQENDERPESAMADPARDNQTIENLLQSTNGQPILVRHKWFAGQVIQSAIGCEDISSNLPLQPSFVPLISTLLESLARPESLLPKLVCGNPVALQRLQDDDRILSLPQVAFVSRMDDAQFAVGKEQFDGSEQNDFSTRREFARISFDENGRAVFSATEQAGLYFLAEPSDDRLSTAFEPPMFAIASHPEESNLDLLSTAELQQLAIELGADIAETAEAFAQIEQQRRDGREIWRPFIALVLALLFFEMLLSQRLLRGAM